jgi:DNA-binding MarR family transcriptional regulator
MKTPVIMSAIAKAPLAQSFISFRTRRFHMLSQALVHYARDRLNLSQRERIRFRLAPQISLEILLILAAERGSTPLTRLFDQIAAAEKSIRSHVRVLMASGLLEEEKSRSDRRAKLLRLTPRGVDDLLSHLAECPTLPPRENAL